MRQILSDYCWPSPHPADTSDLEMLRVALHEDDWSHSHLATLFESRFAEYVGAKHAMLVPSGTAAIYLSLVAAGIRPGQEVIVPGLTWPSVVYAIVKAGGVPKAIDISRDSLCVEADDIEKAIGPKTFAVLPTHLFGSQCDMVAISKVTDECGILVIEDAAQSVGSIQNGKHCGTWGTAGAFSLNDKKVLACGEGGCIVTDNDEIYEELKKLQLILPERSEVPNNLPGTYKVSEFQAAVALTQLAKLDAKLELMSRCATILSRDILLGANGDIKIQKQPESVECQSYYNFCLLVDGDVNVREYRESLSKQLNVKVSGPYAPLSEVSDLRPTDMRLGAEIARNLKTRLPNCLEAFERTCVRLPHFVLTSDPEIMPVVADTILATFEELR